jgi:hypothetical protein
MTTVVSNPTGDKEEKIHHVAELLRSSSQAMNVFKAVYSGKKTFKSIEDIEGSVDVFNAKTYRAASRLANEGIVSSKKVGSKVFYGKDGFYTHNKPRILTLANNPARLKALPTKRNPRVQVNVAVRNYCFVSKPQIEQLYIDDTSSFEEVKTIKKGTHPDIHQLQERVVNGGICKILGHAEKKDWGGEKNDIFGSITLKGKRYSAAFALKGRATQGILIPKKMGANGDQVQRLFETTAQVHFVVYHDKVAESIYDLMQSQAIYKSVASSNRKIYYCVIDGDDLNRLITAYPRQFGTSK